MIHYCEFKLVYSSLTLLFILYVCLLFSVQDFYCNWVFMRCCIVTFTSVNDLITSPVRSKPALMFTFLDNSNQKSITSSFLGSFLFKASDGAEWWPVKLHSHHSTGPQIRWTFKGWRETTVWSNKSVHLMGGNNTQAINWSKSKYFNQMTKIFQNKCRQNVENPLLWSHFLVMF